jgi:Asp-tRNA(Asn)/Glu-tRNA(Gln) amidotransferase A subunit family amidase
MALDSDLSRKEFLASLALAAASVGVPKPTIGQGGQPQTLPQVGSDITAEDLKLAEKLYGLQLTDEQRAGILNAVRGARRNYDGLRSLSIDYQVEPPTPFVPWGRDASGADTRIRPTAVRGLRRPEKGEDLAFLSVRELGHLLRAKQVSPVELTKLYLERLSAYGDKLLCLVTPMEDRALQAAKQAEEDIMRGQVRGPLHGIPCGIKDLFATKGYPTTWGSEPHKSQRFDYDAGVVEKLDAAGAVIVAKLSLGALAQGDMWFKGRTKNPWNPAQGSSGSSAGSASATAAGLVAFSIGTETLGSIVSPSHQCRVTGLRPTYGRVTRYGAMAVSWTMDKIGPLCRNAEDCALAFSAIHGRDPRDRSTVDRPFGWRPDVDLSKLKIGFLIGANDDPKDLSRLERDEALRMLVSLGARLTPVRFDPTPQGVNMVLGVEAAAAFDDFTRSPSIELLKNSSWPNTYRSNQYVPAVEYLQAMRGRWLLMKRFEEQLGDLDLFVASERGGNTLLTTNLTGHPQVLVPFGSTSEGAPRSVSLVGRLYGESTLLALANKLQQAAGYHKQRPDLSRIE